MNVYLLRGTEAAVNSVPQTGVHITHSPRAGYIKGFPNLTPNFGGLQQLRPLLHLKLQSAGTGCHGTNARGLQGEGAVRRRPLETPLACPTARPAMSGWCKTRALPVSICKMPCSMTHDCSRCAPFDVANLCEGPTQGCKQLVDVRKASHVLHKY